MNATRVMKTATGVRHLAFEAKVGALYLTRLGRIAKLTGAAPDHARGDALLTFVYCDEAGKTDRQGAKADGFDMHEGLAARLMTRIA